MNECETALEHGLANCEVCGQLARLSSHAAVGHCPRCGARLYLRKPDSLSRTLAYLIAAFVLYIPANLLPIMRTRTLFGEQDDTILSGVVYLWNDGSWLLAMIVFVASITVPLAKLIVLSMLLWSVHRESPENLQQRSRLYRLLEFVGRWSMLDVYVVALLTSLVRLQSLATIKAGPAAVAFGSVVVLTLLAAQSFDPRLIWDKVPATMKQTTQAHD